MFQDLRSSVWISPKSPLILVRIIATSFCHANICQGEIPKHTHNLLDNYQNAPKTCQKLTRQDIISCSSTEFPSGKGYSGKHIQKARAVSFPFDKFVLDYVEWLIVHVCIVGSCCRGWKIFLHCSCKSIRTKI